MPRSTTQVFVCPDGGWTPKVRVFYPWCDRFLGVKNECRRKAAVVACISSKKHKNHWNEPKIAITLHRQKEQTTLLATKNNKETIFNNNFKIYSL